MTAWLAVCTPSHILCRIMVECMRGKTGKQIEIDSNSRQNTSISTYKPSKHGGGG